MNPNAESSQQALSQLQQAQSQAQNPNDILANQRQQLGVNGAQETVTGLRGAINNTTKLLKQVAPSVMGRTGNSLVTNAQSGRIIQNEQAPIAQNLTDQGTQYTQASEDLGRLEDQAGKAASGLYQGQQDKLSYAQNLYNTLYQKERDAEASRQAEADRQEQIRQFNEQLAASQRESAASRAAAAKNFILTGGKDNAKPDAQPSLQDQVYQSVQSFLDKGSAAANSDYLATLKSAQNGNEKDKLKVELYNQKGIGSSLGVGIANSGSISVPGSRPYNPVTLSGRMQ